MNGRTPVEAPVHELGVGQRVDREAEPVARIVCDYIAGMTDIYIYEQYDEFCG